MRPLWGLGAGESANGSWPDTAVSTMASIVETAELALDYAVSCTSLHINYASIQSCVASCLAFHDVFWCPIAISAALHGAQSEPTEPCACCLLSSSSSSLQNQLDWVRVNNNNRATGPIAPLGKRPCAKLATSPPCVQAIV